MGYARFSFLQINVRRLAGLLQNAGGEQISPVSSLQGGGRCSRGVLANQTAWARAKPPWRNSLACYCAATASCFDDCSNERVSPLRGTTWGAFIGDGKHAEKFAAVISLAE